MSTASATRPLVAVTGGNGYIASVLIDELVQRGYRVNTTVRSLDKAVPLQTRFPSVTVFEADLLTPGSFDATFAGCEVVFHTASPVLMQSADPENEIVRPAVEGTTNAIRSALATPSVRRIILTSSIVAAHTPGSKATVVEADWNADADSLNPATGYPRSKALAERAAWKLIEEYQASEAFKTHPVTMVAILPTLVLGSPVFKDAIRSSLDIFVKLVDGSFKSIGGMPYIVTTLVDVREVAKAHIDAAERTELKGRLLAASRHSYTLKEVAEILRRLYPQLDSKIPNTYLSEVPMFDSPAADPTLTEQQLGWKFNEKLEHSLKFVGELLAEGFLKA